MPVPRAAFMRRTSVSAWSLAERRTVAALLFVECACAPLLVALPRSLVPAVIAFQLACIAALAYVRSTHRGGSLLPCSVAALASATAGCIALAAVA